MQSLNELRKQYFLAVRATGALIVREEPFKLRSGGSSHIYLSHNNFLSEYQHVELLARIYRELIEEHIQGSYRVCAVDSVMSPVIVGAFAVLAKKDVLVVKEQKLSHGTEQQVFGVIDSNEVVVVDDMTSTGGTLISAIGILREKGARVNYAVVSATRDQVAHERVKDLNVRLLHIASFSDILTGLWNDLSEEEKQLVATELGPDNPGM